MHTHMHAGSVNSSYIPQTEQHEPEGRMLFHLGNVTDLLDVTPSNPIPHPLSPPPILSLLFKVKDLVAKQHPTNIKLYLLCTILADITSFLYSHGKVTTCATTYIALQ